MGFKHRFKVWSLWRKKSKDHVCTKIFVLFNIIHAPTFEIFERYCEVDDGRTSNNQ